MQPGRRSSVKIRGARRSLTGACVRRPAVGMAPLDRRAGGRVRGGGIAFSRIAAGIRAASRPGFGRRPAAFRPWCRNRTRIQAQQTRFNRFRAEYNEERPHEALDQATPASIYQPSARTLPRTLPPLEYPAHFEVRLVSRNSGIRWNRHWVCVTHTLAGEYVGLEEVDDGFWDVYFGPLKLGRMDERILRIEITRAARSATRMGRRPRPRPPCRGAGGGTERALLRPHTVGKHKTLLPMSPDCFVTYLPGRSTYLAGRSPWYLSCQSLPLRAVPHMRTSYWGSAVPQARSRYFRGFAR